MITQVARLLSLSSPLCLAGMETKSMAHIARKMANCPFMTPDHPVKPALRPSLKIIQISQMLGRKRKDRRIDAFYGLEIRCTKEGIKADQACSIFDHLQELETAFGSDRNRCYFECIKPLWHGHDDQEGGTPSTRIGYAEALDQTRIFGFADLREKCKERCKEVDGPCEILEHVDRLEKEFKKGGNIGEVIASPKVPMKWLAVTS